VDPRRERARPPALAQALRGSRAARLELPLDDGSRERLLHYTDGPDMTLDDYRDVLTLSRPGERVYNRVFCTCAPWPTPRRAARSWRAAAVIVPRSAQSCKRLWAAALYPRATRAGAARAGSLRSTPAARATRARGKVSTAGLRACGRGRHARGVWGLTRPLAARVGRGVSHRCSCAATQHPRAGCAAGAAPKAPPPQRLAAAEVAAQLERRIALEAALQAAQAATASAQSELQAARADAADAEVVCQEVSAALAVERRRADAAEAALRAVTAAAERELQDAKRAIDRGLAAVGKRRRQA